MTNEEMQKAMEFIVEHEARSSAKIDALAEAQTRNTEGIRALLSIAEIHEREINTLSHQISSISRDISSISPRYWDSRPNHSSHRRTSQRPHQRRRTPNQRRP